MTDGALSLDPTINGIRRVFCCHGGTLSGLYTPNSLEAVRECVEAGAPRLEVDVRFLADDSMLIFHDAVLEKATNGSGRVDELSRADVGELCYRGTPGTGLCFLEDVVDVVSGSDTLLQVDLKLSRPITATRAGLLERALLRLGERVMVGSQAHWNLRALRGLPVAFDTTLQWCYAATSPGLPRHLGAHGFWDDSPIADNQRFTFLEYAEERIRDLEGLVPLAVEWMVDIGTVLRLAECGMRLGDRLRADGIGLAAWTLHADQPDMSTTLARLFEAGTEAVITDVPWVAAEGALAAQL